MKKRMLTSILALTLSAAFTAAALSGCGAQEPSGAASGVASRTPSAAADSSAVGAVLLSVNPEIEIEYDRQGLVLEVEGLNDDGRSIVSRYGDFSGKTCQAVLNELVQEIYDAGYFEKTVDGHDKNIVVKLETGSVSPDSTFLEDLARSIRKTADACGITSAAMTVDRNDLDERGYISLDKAKELVLAQLGLQSAVFHDRSCELDDGVYELEFTADGVTYEYDVHARTGKILEADMERNDDWDDLLDRDDPDDRDDFDDRYDHDDFDDCDDWDDRDDFDDWDDRCGD
jgi:uncharacterized membrane protein YkoI